MNYIFAFLLCLAGTVLTALGGSANTYWLIVSDANVAIWLTVAYLLDRRRA